MQRTRLINRVLPSYTKGEEIFNMVTHIVGGGLGVIILITCVLYSAFKDNVWGIVSSAIYGASVITLYSMSSIYHGLHKGTAKKVMQVLDHCTIYFLIAGTYTPILLCAIRQVSPVWCWVVFGIEWGLTALAIVLTAIDLKKYSAFSMICYIGMGWCIVIVAKVALQSIVLTGILYLLAGGISYTVGAVLYGVGIKRRYMHSVFHIFVVLGTVLQYICILFYVL